MSEFRTTRYPRLHFGRRDSLCRSDRSGLALGSGSQALFGDGVAIHPIFRHVSSARARSWVSRSVTVVEEIVEEVEAVRESRHASVVVHVRRIPARRLGALGKLILEEIQSVDHCDVTVAVTVAAHEPCRSKEVDGARTRALVVIPTGARQRHVV